MVKKWAQVFSWFTYNLQLKSRNSSELILLDHCCLINKCKLTASIIQSLILMIKMTYKRTWMSWLGCTRQCKKNRKQHHIQNQSNFLPWYLINGLECTVQDILISLNSLFELHMKSKKVAEILAKPAPEKKKSFYHWNTSSSNKRFWRWLFQ